MKRLTFKEYYESKQKLIKESDEVIRFFTTHDVYKYCKVPFLLEETKTYLSFKPKDNILVEWERNNGIISPIGFKINDKQYAPTWNSKKMKSWVETSTTQIFD